MTQISYELHNINCGTFNKESAASVEMKSNFRRLQFSLTWITVTGRSVTYLGGAKNSSDIYLKCDHYCSRERNLRTFTLQKKNENMEACSWESFGFFWRNFWFLMDRRFAGRASTFIFLFLKCKHKRIREPNLSRAWGSENFPLFNYLKILDDSENLEKLHCS